MPAYNFTVTDSQSQQPISKALCTIIAGLGGGTIPFNGETDASGQVTVDTLEWGPLFWSVQKAGYITVEANGAPSTNQQVSMTPDPTATQYTLEVESSIGGTTSPAPGTYTYNEGEIVTLRATPIDLVKYRFDHWQVSTLGSRTDNPISLTINQNIHVTAFFTALDGNGGDGGGASEMAAKIVTAIGIILGLALIGEALKK